MGNTASADVNKELYTEEEYVDGIEVVNGKVGGKIPVDEFKKIRKKSVKNANADSITLGRYTKDSSSYIAKAGKHSSYFDLGSEWDIIQEKYKLTESEMFEYFNKPALSDAIRNGKIIRFSHNPVENKRTFLESEWNYIKKSLDVTDKNLVKIGDMWYVE